MIMLIHFILSHDTRTYSVFQVTEVGGLQRSSEQDDFFFSRVVLSPVLFQSSQEGWHLGCEDFFNPLAHQCDLDE